MPVPMIASCFVIAMQKAHIAHTAKVSSINDPIFPIESLFIYHLVLELRECSYKDKAMAKATLDYL